MISIIIPVYNHQDALDKTFASIAAQTYTDIEVIVVDDGSTSEISISNSTATFSSQLIRQHNAGAPAARNTGMKKATGEYIIFWDADVVAEPTMLETMVGMLEVHSDVNFVYSNMSFGSHRMPARPFSMKQLKKNNYIHSTSLIRLSDAIRWDESLHKFQDWDYFLTLAEQGKTGVWIDAYLFSVGTDGTMSTWLPRFAYYPPFKWLPGIHNTVRRYEEARSIIQTKHDL